MVYIERTSKGEDSYYFDVDKLTSKEGISSEINSSSNEDSCLKKIHTSEDTQKVVENDTPDLSVRVGFLQFLHLIEKLRNYNRVLQTNLSNVQEKIEKLISENYELQLENYKLKLDVNKDSPRGVSLSTKNKVIPDNCDPNKNASSQPLNNAGIVFGKKKSPTTSKHCK